jgi:hypothetical protein
MAKPVIAAGKKRYSVTLTEATVERFQALVKQTGVAASITSICDLAIESTANQLQIFKDNGTIRISDIFNLVGQQMDLIEDEGRKNSDEKRKTAEVGKKSVKRGNQPSPKISKKG